MDVCFGVSIRYFLIGTQLDSGCSTDDATANLARQRVRDLLMRL